MTSIQGDRATVNCARCNSKIVLHDVIGRSVTWQGEYLNILFPPYSIDTDNTLCPDCEPMSEADFLSLAATEPVDPDNLPTGILAGAGYTR